jgi:hypothetical protein
VASIGGSAVVTILGSSSGGSTLGSSSVDISLTVVVPVHFVDSIKVLPNVEVEKIVDS